MQTSTPSGTEAFHYDAANNRTSGPGPKDTRYEIDPDANQLKKGRLLNYDYDNRGNQLTRTVANGASWTQNWDSENRLVEAIKTKGAEVRTVSFAYDPFGRRIKKTFAFKQGDTTIFSATWQYVYDNEDIVRETYTEPDKPAEITFFVHGPGIDEPLAFARGSQYYTYHADGLGSVAAIVDANSNIVEHYIYDSYGMVKPSKNFRNAYTFTGREWDKETGLIYFRGRYGDPMDGKFISKDPIGFAGGINLYSYVQNNPINFIDPSGLSPQDRVKWALDQLSYNRDFWKGSFFGKKNKCNEFVDAAHNQGDPDAKNYPTVNHNGYKKPLVSDLADPNFENTRLDYLPIKDAQPGDIVVWYGNDTHHTAIYLGDDVVVYQQKDLGVKLNTVDGFSNAVGFTGTPIIRRYKY